MSEQQCHHEIATLLRSYVDDVHGMLDAFLREESARDALGDMATIRETLRREELKPATHVQFGSIGDTGAVFDDEPEWPLSLRRFLLEHCGRRFRLTWEIVDEPHDTERPPPMFSRDEIDTLDPVVRTLGDADELTRSEGNASSYTLYGDQR